VALKRVAQIAREQGAAVSLFHVSDADSRDPRPDEKLALRAEEMLCEKISSFSLSDQAGVRVHVATGKQFVEIIRRAREEGAELVVLGAHGEHFFKDLLLGTTAEKVVRKGDRLVLVVKRPARGAYRRVLAAVDFSENSRMRWHSRCASLRRPNSMLCTCIRGSRLSSGARAFRKPRSCAS